MKIRIPFHLRHDGVLWRPITRSCFSSRLWLLALFALVVSGVSVFAAPSNSPVLPGVERLASIHSNVVETGELLLSELRCVNCHQATGALEERLPTVPGPNLNNLSERVRFDFVIKWLIDPSATKPGTTMPHLLNGYSEAEREQIAKALAQFLFSGKKVKAEPPPTGSRENGQLLFHSVGCIACHEPEPGFKPTHVSEEIIPPPVELPSVPLGNLREKYTFSGLAKFLLNPLESRPAARMPRTPMTETEANDLAAYLLDDSIGVVPEPDPALIQRGKNYFRQLQCAACHSLGDNVDAAANDKGKPASLVELSKRDQGCLAAQPSGASPVYNLSPAQRQSIEAALANLPKAKPLSAQERIRRMTVALNCIACHKRDNLGGPEAGRACYFQTTGADLEDEGRFPPTLTGVGRKLTTEALADVLRGTGAIRPYMTTRMPDFGPAHSKTFSQYVAEADHREVRPLQRDKDESQAGRSPWGRELVGSTGLGCISCHDLNGTRSSGIRAVDLAFAPKRLRPEWFRDYLIDPATFRPGTRMPSFWPEGKAVSSLVGGKTDRQIDSIWVYLNEIDQNRLPEGMEEKGQFELKPGKAPIIFRTFMKGAGFHAIAVGFPQKVNLAFDGEGSRWAMAWRGRFLDAEGTWDDRFAPPATPLGTNVITFPSGFALSREKRDSVSQPSFEGYRLDRQGIPTFLYKIESLEIEDTCTPDDDGQIARSLKMRHGTGTWWFRAGNATRISREQNEWICGGYKVALLSHDSMQPEITTEQDRQELWIPVRFDGRGTATVKIRFTW